MRGNLPGEEAWGKIRFGATVSSIMEGQRSPDPRAARAFRALLLIFAMPLGYVGYRILFTDELDPLLITEIPLQGSIFLLASLVTWVLVWSSCAGVRQPTWRALAFLFLASWAAFLALEVAGFVVPTAPARGPFGDDVTSWPSFEVLFCPEGDGGVRGINTTCNGDGWAVMLVLGFVAFLEAGAGALSMLVRRSSRSAALPVLPLPSRRLVWSWLVLLVVPWVVVVARMVGDAAPPLTRPGSGDPCGPPPERRAHVTWVQPGALCSEPTTQSIRTPFGVLAWCTDFIEGQQAEDAEHVTTFALVRDDLEHGAAPVVLARTRIRSGSRYGWSGDEPVVLQDGIVVVDEERLKRLGRHLEHQASWAPPGRRRDLSLAADRAGDVLVAWEDRPRVRVAKLRGRDLVPLRTTQAVADHSRQIDEVQTRGALTCVTVRSLEESGRVMLGAVGAPVQQGLGRWLVLDGRLGVREPALVERFVAGVGVPRAIGMALALVLVGAALAWSRRSGRLLAALRRRSPGGGLWIGEIRALAEGVAILRTASGDEITVRTGAAELLGFEEQAGVSGPCVVVGHLSASARGAYRSELDEVRSGRPFAVLRGGLEDALSLAAVPRALALRRAMLVSLALTALALAGILL